MGGIRVGLLGTEPDSRLLPGDDDILGGGDPPGTLGVDRAVPLDTIARIIASVDKDWDPDSPRTTPPISVGGKTLAEVAAALNQLPEWGEGGGQLRTDPIDPGNSTNLTVKLHANLVRRMPTWTGYDKASDAAKTAWNHMYRKLGDHEDRHVAIAVEEAEQLAKDLIGKDISKIRKMVTEANKRMQKRQNELDDASNTDHGAKPGVPYGDVILDPNL